jgi:hypothetical protein
MPVQDKSKFEAHAQLSAEEVTAVQLPKFDDEDKGVSDQSFVSELLYLDDLETILPFRATEDQLQKMTAEIMAEQTEAERKQVQQTDFERVDAARKDHSNAERAITEAKAKAKAAAAVAAEAEAKANAKKNKKQMKAQAKANKKKPQHREILRSNTVFEEGTEQPTGQPSIPNSFEIEESSISPRSRSVTVLEEGTEQPIGQPSISNSFGIKESSFSPSSSSVPQLTPEEHEVERTRLILVAAAAMDAKTSKTTYEVFCRWLGSIESELADQLRKSLAGKRWSELGPLLVYCAILESRTSYLNPKKYGPFLFAGGRSGLQLTKFSMKGAWGVTKVAGKIAIPVTRAALKSTALINSVALGSMAYMEETFTEAGATQIDATQVKALFSWIHDELGVATSMAVIAYSDMELEKSLAEIRDGVTGETDGKKKKKGKKGKKGKGAKPELELEAEPQSELESDGLQLIKFSTWFTSESELAGKLRTAVSEKKSGEMMMSADDELRVATGVAVMGSGSDDAKSEDDGTSRKEEKQREKKLQKRLSKDAKRLSKDAEDKTAAKTGSPQSQGAITSRKAAALKAVALREHAELSQHLHEELDKIAEIFETHVDQAEFDGLMQELDTDGDGELEFGEFCSKQ